LRVGISPPAPASLLEAEWSARSTSSPWIYRTATAAWCRTYPAERSETFCEGHNAGFEFFGGVPRSILYDNTTLAVASILGDGRRLRTKAFGELQSHYLFADRFGRPGQGNDQGKVEGLVGYARRNFMVPIPRAASFAELNAQLPAHCRRRLGDRLRGHDETIGERLVRDQATLLPLPVTPYEACEKKAVRVCPWCAAGATTTRCRPPTATVRCWSAARSTRW